MIWKKIRLVTMAIVLVMTLCACGEKESYTSLAEKSLAQQNYTEALSGFQKALEMGEDAEVIYRGIGLTYMGQGQYRKAIDAFQSALDHGDMTPADLEYDINYYMAISYYKLGEYTLAINIYDSILALKPAADAYYLRGYMKLNLNEMEGCLADFDEAIAMDKYNYSRYLDIFESLRNHGYEDEAQVYLDKMLMADESKFSNYDKARLAFYDGDYEKACNFIELVRENEPELVDGALISFLGECYKRLEKYDYAIAVYGGYVDQTPDAEIYNQLGLCYFERGDYNQALVAFQNGQNVLENNTCMQILKLNEIACYEQMYDFATAREKLAEYLETYPVTSELQKEYAFLTTR